MRRETKITLGALLCWPLLYTLMFLGALAYERFFGVLQPTPDDPGRHPAVFVILLVPTMLANLVAFGACLLVLFRTQRVSRDKRVLWTVLLVVANMVAMPVFWYLHIWKDEAPAEET